jgi:ActR/RegA family two-component response regulator/DNA-binding XRE family transcriptional regulator
MPSGETVQPNGLRVIELRKARDWTQEELAGASDCSKRTIETIEAGNKSVLRRTLAAVAKALGVAPEQITAGPTPEEPAAKPPQAPKRSLLVVDDDTYCTNFLARLLSPPDHGGFDVLTANNVDEAQALFAERQIDIVLTDQRMPGRTGVDLLEWVRQHHPGTVRLLMTQFDDWEPAVEAINRGGVSHLFRKPWRIEEVLSVFRDVSHKLDLMRSRAHLLEHLAQMNQQLLALEAARHRAP